MRAVPERRRSLTTYFVYKGRDWAMCERRRWCLSLQTRVCASPFTFLGRLREKKTNTVLLCVLKAKGTPPPKKGERPFALTRLPSPGGGVSAIQSGPSERGVWTDGPLLLANENQSVH